MRTVLTLGLGLVGLAVAGCGSTEDDEPPGAGPAPALAERLEVLARLPFRHDNLPSLRVDDERVYVGVNEVTESGESAGRGQVFSLPKAGGELAEVGEPLPAIRWLQDAEPALLVVSRDEGGRNGHGARQGGRDGGGARQITALAAADDEVFAACVGAGGAAVPSVQRLDWAGEAQTELWRIGDVRALAVQDGELFLATNGTGVWRRALEDGAAPVRVNDEQLPPGAQVTFVTDGADGAGDAEGARLFWAVGGTLAEVSLGDGSVSEQAYESEAARVGRLASAPGSLVWSELDDSGGGLGVRRWSLESGEHRFGELEGVGLELATDGSYVYGVTGYEVWRVPLSALDR